ncbi:hypothetical protein V5799_025671 [Amblyomma americanum]|uniref:Aldehyde dehydrogenase domain-containing protein n=1 Tax=Amblyomma americanum TaxID=6943 RepID=A0AAQ4E8S9_AMBAM
MELETFGAKVESVPFGPCGISSTSRGGDMGTYKMFYGGQQKRSLSNVSNSSTTNDQRTVGYFSEAGSKDVRNAVEAALAGFKAWSSRSAHNRAQVLFYLAENLQLRKAEMVALIRNMNNKPEAACEAEVSACIRRLFYWAATCDKDAGSVRSTATKGTVVRVNEAVGVIGIACAEDSCLLSNFVSAMATALAAGNSVVVLAPKEWPQPALRFCQILETSDVPPGVVNVLSGKERPVLLRALAEHHDISAIWYHGQVDSSAAFLEYAASHSDKRTWVFPVQDSTDQDHHWMGWRVSQHTTQPKSIWLPYGDTFGN